MAKATAEKQNDGRHERTERTRQRILDATRDLILKGSLALKKKGPIPLRLPLTSPMFRLVKLLVIRLVCY